MQIVFHANKYEVFLGCIANIRLVVPVHKGSTVSSLPCTQPNDALTIV